jgi:alpha-tubulin suppressor-like RCC1 family protein
MNTTLRSARSAVGMSTFLVALLLGASDIDAQPAGATRPGPAAGVRSVAAGGHHTCAVLSKGTVACWGLNADGQLGHGEPIGAPVVVQGIATAVAIVTGRGHTCAVLADGTVTCWGANAQGQLGRATQGEHLSGAPAPVDGISTATVISAGRDHTAPSQTLAPVPVEGLAAATAVAIGENFACASRGDLTLVCWGMNDRGQIGAPELRAAARPIMVTGVAWPVAATAGRFHACALRRDGTIRCWGDNAAAQLGRDPTVKFSHTTVLVELPR